MEDNIPTLFEWAGGAEALERWVNAFYDLTLKDDILRPYFEHMSPEHRHYVALWIGEVFGGPKGYSQIHGEMKGHRRMIIAHQQYDIPEPARLRWIQLMSQAADIEKIPDDPEFRSAVMAYFEWGTRMQQVFLVNPVPDESPVPTWGWGERKPFIPPKG